MQWNTDLLDKFVAPVISTFTTAMGRIPSILRMVQFCESAGLLAEFVNGALRRTTTFSTWDVSLLRRIVTF